MKSRFNSHFLEPRLAAKYSLFDITDDRIIQSCVFIIMITEEIQS